MFRFLLGAAVAVAAFYVVSNRPEWVHQAVDVGRQQFDIATRNIQAAVKGEHAAPMHEAEAQSSQTDFARVERIVPSMERLSSDQLWLVMNEDDYDRQAAAGQILLARSGIPASQEGVDLIRRTYLRSNRPETLQAGFNYVGLVALQGVRESSIVRLAQGYVERHPQDQACDNALWALGELGSEDMVPYFFAIIENENKYGVVARKRAFCCLAQCGRYSPARRFEMVPRFIQVYEHARDPQTRSWAIQALAHCAPGVRAKSFDQWKSWWAAH